MPGLLQNKSFFFVLTFFLFFFLGLLTLTSLRTRGHNETWPLNQLFRRFLNLLFCRKPLMALIKGWPSGWPSSTLLLASRAGAAGWTMITTESQRHNHKWHIFSELKYSISNSDHKYTLFYGFTSEIVSLQKACDKEGATLWFTFISFFFPFYTMPAL